MMTKSGVVRANWMKEAIKEALCCEVDVPVGCVIVFNGKVIASAHNCREIKNDIVAHAEILAIQKAQEVLESSRLSDCDLYVTLEPCPMCSWAIIQAGIRSVYFGSFNKQYGAIESVIRLQKLAKSKLKVYGGIEEDFCNKILEDFFNKIR